MKKIVHVLSSKSFSGAENVVINIINTSKQEYEVVYLCRKGSIEKKLIENDIQYFYYENFRSLIKILNLLKADIIHAHDFRASIKIGFVLSKAKKISHIHQNPKWIKKINLSTLLYFICSIFFEKIIFVSSEIKKEFYFSKFLKKKILVLENCLNKNEILKKAAIKKNEEKLYDLAYIGRLSPEKDPIRFIQIVQKVIEKRKDLKAIIVGDGQLREMCEKYIEKHNLHKNIFLQGFSENPYEFIKKSKIIVITSKYEGFGLVALEAMILGKPVVANNVGGLKKIIPTDSNTLFNSNSECVDKIIDIIRDNKLYENLCEKSVINSKKYTNIEKWKSKLRDIYSI